MINKKNYIQKTQSIDFSELSKDVQDGKALFDEITNSGTDWELYEADTEIREAIDLYFQAVSIEVGEYETAKKSIQKPKIDEGRVSIIRRLSLRHLGVDITEKLSEKDNLETATGMSDISYVKWYAQKYNLDVLEEFPESKSKSQKTRKRKPRKPVKRKVPSFDTAKPVETFSDELKFIRRYVNMHGKHKSRNQIRLFINALQKAIRERRIRKTSAYAKQVMLIQNALIKMHGAFKGDSHLIEADINQKTRASFAKILGKEVELLSVKFIKSYINLQGKVIENKKASYLLNRIKNAIDKKRFGKRDLYWNEVQQIIKNLTAFVNKNPNQGMLEIEQRTLNGLNGIVGCTSCQQEMNGIPDKLDIDSLTEEYFSKKIQGDNRFLLNSKAYSNINFQTLGFKGKWLELFGDPEIGFSAVLMGNPKMGKSTLAIEFSGDMAKENKGDVLYVAREEGKSETFKRKLEEAAAAHDNLYVSNYIPESVGDYRFVIIDSVTKMGLTSRHLEALNGTYLETSFIGVHQVTKDGKARGTNEFIHDADVIIHVYEPGRARSRGRFNDGGEIDFFNEQAA